MATVFVIDVENLATNEVKRNAVAGTLDRAMIIINALCTVIGFTIRPERVEAVGNVVKYSDPQLGMVIILTEEILQ